MSVGISDNNIFNKIYKFISVIAYIAILTPLPNILVFENWDINPVLRYTLPGLMFAVGYGIQNLCGKVLKIKRKAADENISYEQINKFFHIKDAVLSVFLTFIIGFGIYNIVEKYMMYRVEIGLDPYYDYYAAYPYIMFIISVIIMIFGIVLWFYPFNRIISMYIIPVSISVFLVYFLLSSRFSFSQTNLTSLLIICYIVFIICAVFMMNQNYLIKIFNIAKTGIITSKMRFYNAGIIIVFLIGVVLLFIIFAAILIGVSVYFKQLLFITLNANRSSEEYRDAAEIISNFNNITPRLEDKHLNALFMILLNIFRIIVVFGILALIFIRKINTVFKSILNFVMMLLNNIYAFFSNLYTFLFGIRRKNIEYNFTNYKDEEEKIIYDHKNAGDLLNVKKIKSYREYISKLNSIRSAREKFKFAYQNLVKCWHDMQINIKASDTPRQIKNKLTAKMIINELHEITDLFELAHYSDKEIDETRLDNNIRSINILIQNYYE